MATGDPPSPPQPKDPVTSLRDCPHCGSLCLGPRILPCGHVLCRRCLREVLHLTGSGCPRCKQPLRLPKDRTLTSSQMIKQLSPDPVVENLVYQELERDGDLRCLNCPNKKAAKVCLDCQDCYCEVCARNHLRAQNGKDHVLRLLSQALQNVSSTASTKPDLRSAVVGTSSSVESIHNLDDPQSRRVSREESGGVVGVREGWVKKEVGLLEQASSEHQEVKTTLQNIVNLGQQLMNTVTAHQQALDAYHQHLSRLDVTTQATDPSSDVRGCDDVIIEDLKTESLEKRLRDVRDNHHCPGIETLKTIMTQLTQLLPAEEEKNPGSSSINPKNSTTSPSTQHTSTTTPHTPHPTPDDTPTLTPRVDMITATPQRVFQMSPRAPQDRQRPMITAMACTSDDTLVMIDDHNHNVKAMNVKPPHTLSASSYIPETLWDLAVLPDGLVGITTDKALIYLMRVADSVTVVSKINTVRQYDGIAGHSEGLLVVSCGQSSQAPAAVDVVTRQGQRVRTLNSVGLEMPLYLCPSGDQHVLLSDWRLDVVSKIDVTSGEVTQRFRHTYMMHPLQVCADSQGNVFVVCGNSQCVMVRNSRDGQWKQLLTGSQHSDRNKTFPRGVCLTRSGHLVVSWGERRSDPDSVVICYKFT